MASGDLEHGDRDKFQEGVRCLLNCVQKESNRVQEESNHTRIPISPTIYKVPGVIRSVNARCFSPRVVSIGPLHREDKNVKAFEKQKATFLTSLMSRIDVPPDEILQSCMEKARDSMERIKACYVWTKTYDDVEIAKMMVMDACFILEFLLWDWGEASGEASSQPYPGINLRPIAIMSDLVLLENQIPFFFLNQIYGCTIRTILREDSGNTFTLIEFVKPILHCLTIFMEDIKTQHISIENTNHILSLIHECYKPQDAIELATSEFKLIPSAIDLDMAGVSFEHYKNQTWVMGMEVTPYKFPYLFGCWGKPTLKMSKLIINDFTELVLRNLIAYEQSCQNCDHITSYVYAIDLLVSTKEDVAKLVDSGVLANLVGSNKEAANIINSLGNGLPCEEFFYREQWNTLYEYSNSYWPKRIAWLRRTYFNSPWNIFALLGAIILFALTAVQTVFTIMSFMYV